MVKNIIRAVYETILSAIITLLIIIVGLFLTLEGLYRYYQHQVGDKVVVGVVDSGLKETYPIFDKRIVYPFDTTGWDKEPEDKTGHGTNVSKIIAETDPKATIMPIKIMKKEKDYERLINSPAALFYAVIRGADVVNMSFSEPNEPLTRLAILYGRWKGVIFVAATGNEGKNKSAYPGRYNGVLSVAGVDKEGNLYQDSNIGNKTRFAALSVNVKGVNIKKENKKYYLSGTSMGTAYMSGTIAYILEKHPNWNQKKIEQYLKENSEPVRKYKKRPAKKIRSIEIDKIEARENGQLYIKAKADKTATAKDSIIIRVDALNEDKISYKGGMGISETLASHTKQVTIPLKEGFNYLSFKAHKKNGETKSDNLMILKDTKKPDLQYIYSTKIDGKDVHLFIAVDYDLKNVTINGKNENENIDDRFRIEEDGETTYMFLGEGETFPLHIKAKDSAGNQTEMTVDQRIGGGMD